MRAGHSTWLEVRIQLWVPHAFYLVSGNGPLLFISDYPRLGAGGFPISLPSWLRCRYCKYLLLHLALGSGDLNSGPCVCTMRVLSTKSLSVPFKKSLSSTVWCSVERRNFFSQSALGSFPWSVLYHWRKNIKFSRHFAMKNIPELRSGLVAKSPCHLSLAS